MAATNPATWSSPVWHKSSYSANGGNCVEVARNRPDKVAVRDSQDRHGPVLVLDAEHWREFTIAIKSGPCEG